MEDWMDIVQPTGQAGGGAGAQEGGRIVGQGAYGCIFTPPLQCLNKSKSTGKKGKLGKLTEKEDIANEIDAAVYFRPYAKEVAKYFILPEINTLCKPNLVAAARTEPELKSCTPLMKRGAEKMLHYEVAYGGKTLHKRLDEVNLARDLPFWQLAADLLETGAYLALHGFVHNDMHSNNILVNQAFHPRLIDFGRSFIGPKFNEKKVDELAAYYAPGISHIPPESSTQDGVVEGVAIQKIYQDLKAEKEGIQNVERVLGVSRDAQIAEFRRFWEGSKAAQARDWVAFWRMYWPYIDAWAVGHAIIKILHRLLMTRQFTESAEWKTRGPILKTVLRGLLRTSPKERLDCVEALALFDPAHPLLETNAGASWLAKRHAQRRRVRAPPTRM
jgi:hypothetical protein